MPPGTHHCARTPTPLTVGCRVYPTTSSLTLGSSSSRQSCSTWPFSSPASESGPCQGTPQSSGSPYLDPGTTNNIICCWNDAIVWITLLGSWHNKQHYLLLERRNRLDHLTWILAQQTTLSVVGTTQSSGSPYLDPGTTNNITCQCAVIQGVDTIHSGYVSSYEIQSA